MSKCAKNRKQNHPNVQELVYLEENCQRILRVRDSDTKSWTTVCQGQNAHPLMSEHTRLLRTKVSGSNSASSTVSPAQMGVSVHCLNQLSSSCTMIQGYLDWLAHSEELEPESYRSAFLSIWDRQELQVSFPFYLGQTDQN